MWKIREINLFRNDCKKYGKLRKINMCLLMRKNVGILNQWITIFKCKTDVTKWEVK